MDGLESQGLGCLNVIRVDIQSPTGCTLAPLFHYQSTPTFIFFEAHGWEFWRSTASRIPTR